MVITHDKNNNIYIFCYYTKNMLNGGQEMFWCTLFTAEIIERVCTKWMTSVCGNMRKFDCD